MTPDAAVAGRRATLAVASLIVLLLAGCRPAERASPAPSSSPSTRPSILLITLDTTRADAIGPGATGIQTPAFDALASGGRTYTHAYATVPETLPSHASIMTGLYAAGHGVHENGRTLRPGLPVVAERLKAAGYQTAAWVSSFTLAKRFGLSRGFDVYDDGVDPRAGERAAGATTDAAIGHLASLQPGPVFLWVHYFDPHYPYAPPEPFRTTFARQPYLGEIAYMDQQVGRLVQAFLGRAGEGAAVIAVGDHGEGLGEHGELLHGNLLYQSTMRVPLVIRGPGVAVGRVEAPVSTRRVYHTLLDWAGIDASGSLRAAPVEVVMGEAMRPFLAYGWQPQVMAVDGRHKSILSGRVEIFDVVADPAETRDLAAGISAVAQPVALRDYPWPSTSGPPVPDALDEQARRDLASLGYVSAGSAPLVRKDAPRPADMTGLFDLLDRTSGLFVAGEYRVVIPLLRQIVARDSGNLDAMLRLATSHSMLGQERDANAWFAKAVALAPESRDVRTYLAAHYARGANWERAEPLLEQVLRDTPDRVVALEALAEVRLKQGRLGDALALRQRLAGLRDPSAAEWTTIGDLAMQAEQTSVAIEAFERARRTGRAEARDLELGALYLAARRFVEARDALDRVSPAHPASAMALFKRAQVAVLLQEPDASARIARARRSADATTRDLVAREQLFQGRQ